MQSIKDALTVQSVKDVIKRPLVVLAGGVVVGSGLMYATVAPHEHGVENALSKEKAKVAQMTKAQHHSQVPHHTTSHRAPAAKPRVPAATSTPGSAASPAPASHAPTVRRHKPLKSSVSNDYVNASVAMRAVLGGED